MSMKSLLGLIDDKLEEVFSTKPHDPMKAREPVLKRIEKTREQFLQTEPAKGSKDFRIANAVVAYSPTVKGESLAIGGKTTVFVPSERFPEFLDNMKAAVTSGEFDGEIANPGNGASGVAEVKMPRAKAAKPATSGNSGRGWTPERLAKFKETIAARNAANA